MKTALVVFFSLLAVAAQGMAPAPGRPNSTDIYQAVGKSIFKVIIPGKGSGSGFVISTPRGKRAITNAHVCMTEGNMLYLKRYDGATYVEQALYIDYHADLCVVSLHDQTMPALDLALPALRGDTVFVVGHPHGNSLTVTEGIFVDYQTIDVGYEPPCVDGDSVQQGFFGDVQCGRSMYSMNITAITRPGNSGGPLVNSNGDVVGIVFAGGDGDNFALPVRSLWRVLKDWMATREAA
jgi:S1-C subfamily serine protease